MEYDYTATPPMWTELNKLLEVKPWRFTNRRKANELQRANDEIRYDHIILGIFIDNILVELLLNYPFSCYPFRPVDFPHKQKIISSPIPSALSALYIHIYIYMCLYYHIIFRCSKLHLKINYHHIYDYYVWAYTDTPTRIDIGNLQGGAFGTCLEITY